MAETTCPVCEGFDDTCPACHPATRPAPPADDDRPDVVDRLRSQARQQDPEDEILTLNEAADEIERLRAAYDDRTAELVRVMAERDDLLAEQGIVHRGSEAT